MSDLRTRIAALIDTHDPCGIPGGIDCSCGEKFKPADGTLRDRCSEAALLWSAHLADAVIRDLSLTETAGVVVGCIHKEGE